MTSHAAATPLELCRSFLASFATGDVDLIASHVSDDFVNEHLAEMGVGTVGVDEYRGRLVGYISSMPGLRYEIVDEVSEGDKVVLAYVLRARVNDRDIAVPGVLRFHVVDGRISRRIDCFDSLVFQRQAGLG